MSESRISWPKTLAELLTIIVGVLLALFANNWRDTVRDHAQARAYEARLEQDVASDIQQYGRAAGEAAAIDSAAVQVLAAYRGREVSPRDAGGFVEAVLRASWMPPPAVSRDTYDDLVSTGSLSLLPVGDREAVGAYYRQADVYADREALFRQILARGYWRDPASVLGPDLLPRLWKAMDAARGGAADDDAVVVTASQLAAIVARLRRIPDFEAQIGDVRNVMAQREAWYATHMTAAAKKLRKVLAGAT